MKTLIVLPFICILSSCNFSKPKLVRKQIENNDITIKWYYYSYITDNSPDFVVVEKNGYKKEIYQADYVISDVILKQHDIILKLVKPAKRLAYTEKVEDEVFGYKIVLDTTGTYADLRLVPNGKKQYE